MILNSSLTPTLFLKRSSFNSDRLFYTHNIIFFTKKKKKTILDIDGNQEHQTPETQKLYQHNILVFISLALSFRNTKYNVHALLAQLKMHASLLFLKKKCMHLA
jgi:hypothetical protein